MTLGEKIKNFRILRSMTQKTLGEKAGISESTIRKYELGIRNPKPLQVKKIAQALDLGENQLLDVPLNTLSIETVGDVMALFFLLESRIGFTYSGEMEKDETIDPSTLKLHFNNITVNSLISQWLYEKHKYKVNTDFTNSRKEYLSPEEYIKMTILDKGFMEIKRQNLMRENEPL
ncbi:helix-turn-helix transcriptional regulator [Desulfosporosinus sp.]|uniref:helix-turn-helix domain-containing protein n=1 Tax=Desulfosporosinus sp. TaxID=157907 RepID=UPI002311DBBE|nr:helix-turn-helix transcriptional regulator [Desulfosporosinus sp.]MDA8222510.1 helix-turn-helix transcriptional regulator [Desulfitobacterium hafniense]